MDDASLQQFLLRLFERHEVELEPDEDWLLTDGDFPAIRARWHDGAAGEAGRLDVDVALGEEHCIEESFAGTGSGEAGCRDALEGFIHGALPVLLAACWYVTDERRLQLASWDIGVRGWDAFIGPCRVRGADVTAPAEATAVLAEALRDASLAPQLHWVRWFARRAADGALAVEVLLDNEPWPAGQRALAGLSWPAADTAWSMQALLMLDVRDY
jgi:hypothetical protein